MMRKFMIALMAGSMVAGCQAPYVPSSNPGQIQAVSPNQGILMIRLLWPSASKWQSQYVPAAATRAVVEVLDTQGAKISSVEVSRAVQGSTKVSFDLVPGTGFTVSAKFFGPGESLLAEGSSAPFAIERQRVSNVELTVHPVVTTVAGTGLTNYLGDNGLASSAQLYLPLGLAASNGDLYVTDRSHHAIRKVAANGVITTVAGTGTSTLSDFSNLGDDGPATSGTLRFPNSVAVAPNGDIIIADTTNRRVRIVPKDSGTRYGKTLTAGHLHSIFTSTVTGPYVIGVTVDALGNVLVAERHRIVMLVPDGTVKQVAGVDALTNGAGLDGEALTSPLDLPDSLVCDVAGNVLFSERNNHRIRVLCRQPGSLFGIAMASGSVYTIAGVGNATSDLIGLGDAGDALQASFKTPRGLALGPDGSLFVADTGNHRIRKVTPERTISTWAGTGEVTLSDFSNLADGGTSLKATFNEPTGVVVSHGQMFIGDAKNHRVRRIPL